MDEAKTYDKCCKCQRKISHSHHTDGGATKHEFVRIGDDQELTCKNCLFGQENLLEAEIDRALVENGCFIDGAQVETLKKDLAFIIRNHHTQSLQRIQELEAGLKMFLDAEDINENGGEKTDYLNAYTDALDNAESLLKKHTS